MVVISRLKMLSPLPATSTQPSWQAYALLGAMPGSALPAASRTAPKALYSGSRLSITLNTASCRATSITWPAPPFTLRWYRAIITPMTPCSAANVSPIDTPTRTGTRPGSAVRWRRPPIASPMTPKPGKSRYGPVWP